MRRNFHKEITIKINLTKTKLFDNYVLIIGLQAQTF